MDRFKNTYGFTIKDVKTKEALLSEENYAEILKEWSKKGDILMVVYENKDKKGDKARLHVHGTIKFEKNPFLLKFLKPGFIIKFEQIYDLEGWNKYCNKNIPGKQIQEIKLEKINNTYYMFDD